ADAAGGDHQVDGVEQGALRGGRVVGFEGGVHGVVEEARRGGVVQGGAGGVQAREPRRSAPVADQLAVAQQQFRAGAVVGGVALVQLVHRRVAAQQRGVDA